MPRQPGDARRTNVIPLVIRPIGPPPSVRDLKYVQPLMRGAPQTLLGGESVEVEIGELPRRVELPDQVATGFVGHGPSSLEGSSSVSGRCVQVPPPNGNPSVSPTGRADHWAKRSRRLSRTCRRSSSVTMPAASSPLRTKYMPAATRNSATDHSTPARRH